MATPGGPPEWDPASPFVQHTISSNYSNLQTHDQWQWTYRCTPFTSPTESIDDTSPIWTLFPHTGVYIMTIGLLIPAGLGIFCCYFFWCWLARLMCQLLQPGSMQYTIVNDDVEAALFYRCSGKAKQPKDLMRIMACIWNENLHRWRVDRSSRCSH